MLSSPMNATSREPHGGISAPDATGATGRYPARTGPSTPFPLCRRCRFAWITWIVAVTLIWPFAGHAGEEQGGKRVENRSGERDSTARPVGPMPGSAGSAQAESKKECEFVRKVAVVETTTTTEETHVIKTEEVVVLERTPVPSEPPDLMTFEDVLLNTLGRRKVTTVVASTDAHNPIPSYAFVGFQPSRIERGLHHTVRLLRFECELETGADWNPTHSVFTLAVGAALFQFIADASDIPRNLPVLDTMGARIYPLTDALSKRITAPGTHRYQPSFHFRDAALGHAPPLFPDEGVYLSADSAPSAPLGYSALKFILVDGNEGAESSLRLIEKSGSAVSILPSLNRLELASFCSVVHILRR